MSSTFERSRILWISKLRIPDLRGPELYALCSTDHKAFISIDCMCNVKGNEFVQIPPSFLVKLTLGNSLLSR